MNVSNYVADGGYIETFMGRKFFLNDPVFELDDIAHALGMKVRYGGHCGRFYSVAEHSVLVSELCETLGCASPMEGLLHDCVEAYLPDMPSPIKHVLPDFKALEHRLEAAMHKQFGIEKTPGCKRADLLAMYIEADALLPSRGAFLFPDDPNGLRAEAAQLRKHGFGVVCFQPNAAKGYFLNRYRRLTS